MRNFSLSRTRVVLGLTTLKRDFDLIRAILLQAEKAPAGGALHVLEFEQEVDGAVVADHIQLAIDANLIEGQVISDDPLVFAITRLAWEGHDFLEHARNDTIWKKVRAEAKTKGTSVTIHILNSLLAKAAEKYAGLD
jgi:hypothetical protein